MIEKFLSLFERMVVALEGISAANNSLLSMAATIAKDECAAKPEAAEPKAEKPKKEPKPKAEPKKEPEAPKATLADVKKAVSEYAARRAKEGNEDPKGLARLLMAEFAEGAAKTDDVKEEFFPAVIKACTENWMPEAAQEEGDL